MKRFKVVAEMITRTPLETFVHAKSEEEAFEHSLGLEKQQFYIANNPPSLTELDITKIVEVGNE